MNHTYITTERREAERPLLPPAREAEATYLVHELFLLAKHISSARRRTDLNVKLTIIYAKRLQSLGFRLVWEKRGRLVGGSDTRFNPDKWALLEEWTEPIDPRTAASLEYAQMKAEIARMTIAEATEELRMRRRAQRATGI